MPTYEYKCMICDYRITEIKSLSEADNNKPVCVTCNKEMLRDFKIQTIIFKGNGWGKDA